MGVTLLQRLLVIAESAVQLFVLSGHISPLCWWSSSELNRWRNQIVENMCDVVFCLVKTNANPRLCVTSCTILYLYLQYMWLCGCCSASSHPVLVLAEKHVNKHRNKAVSLAAELYREHQFSPGTECYSLWRTNVSWLLERQKCKVISETTILFV